MSKIKKAAGWSAAVTALAGLASGALCLWNPAYCAPARVAARVLGEAAARIEEAAREAPASNEDPAALTTDDVPSAPAP